MCSRSADTDGRLSSCSILKSHLNITSEITFTTVHSLIKWTQLRQLCCLPQAQKGKVKWLTLPFEVQSSIQEGKPRKELQDEEAEEREEKWTTQCPPYVIYPIVRDTNPSSDALGTQQGIFVYTSSLIWLIYSWERDIVYPHTSQLN